MSDIQFDSNQVNTWVQACKNEAALISAGAPAEEILAARFQVAQGLVSLIAPSVNADEAAALFLLLLQNDTRPQTNSVEESSDPTTPT